MRDEFESRFFSVGSRISLGIGAVVGPVLWLSDRLTNGEPVVEQYGYVGTVIELVIGTAIAVLAGAYFGWGVALMLAFVAAFCWQLLIIALELVRRVSTWLLERLSPKD
jgi:hypothetical protein